MKKQVSKLQEISYEQTLFLLTYLQYYTAEG